MLQGLANGIAALGGWFADPANWTGNDGIPNRLMEHLVICLLSMVAALFVALPIGLYIGHTGRFAFISVQLANIGRAVPSYAVMALLFPLSIAFSVSGPGGDIAYLATFLAMVLLAVPPIVTTTYAGMSGVDGDLREAARGMGMRGDQVLRQVELPLALPVVLTGVTHRRGPGDRHGDPGRRVRRRRPGPLHHPGQCPAGLHPSLGGRAHGRAPGHRHGADVRVVGAAVRPARGGGLAPRGHDAAPLRRPAGDPARDDPVSWASPVTPLQRTGGRDTP